MLLGAKVVPLVDGAAALRGVGLVAHGLLHVDGVAHFDFLVLVDVDLYFFS